ncbi:MAG: hypothetical protein L6R37_007064 [Teloschistes peruensis]|nr:MAG: hypothetical protein L6R37_007064 [Teloschistes peruensis]
MTSEHVLRVVRSDSPGDYILLNASSNGSSPLDLELLATEGSQPYLKTLKHSRISKYRAKSNHLTDTQWESLLRSTLLQERIQEQETEAEDAPSKDVELVATISSTNLTITLRKSISGIHQKLGELTLPASPDTDINVLNWCNTAIARADNLSTNSQSLECKLAEQTNVADKLRAQLEDLIRAKQEHEDAILQKCAVLINEKKAKIRDQQRLLATAKPDPETLERVQSAVRQQRSGTAAASRSPRVSRGGKRKASAPSSSSDEDGFEDGVKVEEKDDGEGEGEGEKQADSEDVTPQHSDLDETADELSEGGEDVVPTVSGAKGKVLEGAEDRSGSRDKGAAPIREERKGEEMPPPRDLPFIKESADTGRAAGAADEGDDGEEDTRMADGDETDDDEL